MDSEILLLVQTKGHVKHIYMSEQTHRIPRFLPSTPTLKISFNYLISLVEIQSSKLLVAT